MHLKPLPPDFETPRIKIQDGVFKMDLLLEYLSYQQCNSHIMWKRMQGWQMSLWELSWYTCILFRRIVYLQVRINFESYKTFYSNNLLNRRNCLAPSCGGGGCTFDTVWNPTCCGGTCSFFNVHSTLTDGYCTGGGCSLDGKPFPSSFSKNLSM